MNGISLDRVLNTITNCANGLLKDRSIQREFDARKTAYVQSNAKMWHNSPNFWRDVDQAARYILKGEKPS